MDSRDRDKIERLHSLQGEPVEQVNYALQLVQKEIRQEVLQAALDMIAEAGEPRSRPVLVAKYLHCEVNASRRDPGCHIRAAILRAMRHLATTDDIEMLERAATNHEFLPPGPVEVGANLRAAALVTMNEVDQTLAGYHSVRLLTDKHTSNMSGEPAVTAVQVLAAQGQELPLYGYLFKTERVFSDVAAECLRNLAAMPASVLVPLLESYRESANEVVLLGLFDLLFAHEALDVAHDFILQFLRETTLYDLYRYVVTTSIASRREELINELKALAKEERDKRKSAMLDEALKLAEKAR